MMPVGGDRCYFATLAKSSYIGSARPTEDATDRAGYRSPVPFLNDDPGNLGAILRAAEP